MAASVEPLLRHLHRLFSDPDVEAASDAVLLDRFVARRDELAFSTLLARHGPMVLGVCRRVLHDGHDAEDVFQAVFLVLARKANSLRRPHALAAWLYGTARHLALKVRRGEARRRQREESSLAVAPSPDPLDRMAARELLLVLDEEIDRLPEAQRLPLLLCGLEGRSHDEAAGLLGCTVGSLKGRLQRGRKRLHARLAARGLAFSAALLTLQVSQGGAAGATARLASATLAYARGEGGSVPEEVARLAESAIAGMTAAKVKTGLALLLLAVSLTAGTGVLAHQTLATKPPSDQQPTAPQTHQPAAAVNKRSGIDLQGDPLPPGAVARLGTMRFRHVGDVISVAYSPDGKVIASGERNDGPVVLWDAATGKELHQLDEGPGVRGGFAFSPDGKHLAWVKWQRWIGLWDVATGKQVRRLTAEAGVCLAFSPDGKRLAVTSGAFGDAVVLLDVASGKEVRRLEGQGKMIYALAFSPDGKLLAAGDADRSAYLWDTSTGKKLHVLKHEQQVPGVAFSADGQTLATASHDRTARFWDVATGKELRRFVHRERDDDAIQTVHFVPKQPRLVTGGVRTIRIWDLSTGKEVRRFPGHFCLCDCPVAVSPDGKKLATRNGEPGQVLLWDLATGKRLDAPGGHQRPIASVAFSHDGRSLATGSWDDTLRLWDTANGKELRRLRLAFDVHAVFTPDGKILAASTSEGSDGFIRLIDPTTGKELRRFAAHKGGVGHLVLAADGKTCVSSGVNRMEWSADRKTLIPGASDKVIRRWRLDTGAEIGRIEGLPKAATALALAPDGKTMLAVEDRTARLWDVASGKAIRDLHGHQGWLGCVAYSPDGKTAAGAGQDKVIHLWDIRTGEEAGRLAGHQDTIQSVRFSPDGRTLASASSDRAVRLWEVATGQERQRFEGHRHAVFTLDFSRDGRLLASAAADATVLIWDVWAARNGEGGPAARLSERELGRLWTALADGKDAAHAYQAMCRLSRDPAGAMGLFAKELRPAPATDDARIARWIADLDSADFAVREQATRELARRGDAIEGALRKELEGHPSLEVRQRIKLLLGKMQGAERLRMLRAAEVLEHLATPEARRLLETLAGGAPQARLTQDARAALSRLRTRPTDTAQAP